MTAHPPTAHTYSPASAPSASTPALPVDDSDELSGAGYRDVEQVRTAEEDLMFSLPKELRQDSSGRRDERALGGRSRA